MVTSEIPKLKAMVSHDGVVYWGPWTITDKVHTDRGPEARSSGVLDGSRVVFSLFSHVSHTCSSCLSCIRFDSVAAFEIGRSSQAGCHVDGLVQFLARGGSVSAERWVNLNFLWGRRLGNLGGAVVLGVATRRHLSLASAGRVRAVLGT